MDHISTYETKGFELAEKYRLKNGNYIAIPYINIDDDENFFIRIFSSSVIDF